MLLSLTTIIVNTIALATGLWLGLYVVTRSPRRGIAWLTSFTLWCLSGHFLNVLLSLAPIRSPMPGAAWLAPVLRFWRGSSADPSTVWLQSWTIIPAVILWLHATSLMRRPHLTRSRRMLLLLGYGGGLAAGLVQTNTQLLLSASVGADPLYVNALQAGPLYPFILTVGMIYVALSLSDLIGCARAAATPMMRSQFHILIVATLLATSVTLVSVAGSILRLRVPIVVSSLPLGAGMVLIGYGVARYSALAEGRTIRRDFYHSAIASSVVILFYLGLTWFAVHYIGLPPILRVVALPVVASTHFLIDAARYHQDARHHHRDIRQTQASLRRLARLAEDREKMDHYLAATLESMCAYAQAIFGLILVFEDEDVRVAAAYGWRNGDLAVQRPALSADDVAHLEPCQFPPPLSEAALLIPLYGGTEQLGALILGRPLNGVGYAPQDVDQLLYPSDRLGEALSGARRRAEHAALVRAEEDPQPPGAIRYPVQVPVEVVEDALRHMADYSYLGAHPLARFRLVQAELNGDAATHLDAGKAVYRMLAGGIEKLRPGDSPGSDPPPREWYPYLILHDAYVAGTSNRDIMSNLYISHGTFNRTRRAALRTLAQTLEEMEEAAACLSPPAPRRRP